MAVSAQEAEAPLREVVVADTFEDEEGQKERWPLWKLALVALPQFGVQVLWCFIGPQAAPYMMHLGITPALSTLNNIAGPTTGFFTGPIVGAWSDRLTSRLGRRRPIILAGLISTSIAGLLFSSAEHMFESQALQIGFAVPMYWIMDITINIMQTPHRALVADLAAKDQQEAMQVVFVVFMSVGNFVGYTIMKIWDLPVEHMQELMLLMVLINGTCIGIQFLVAKEKPLPRSKAKKEACCAAITSVIESVTQAPRLLYHLLFIQCLVWMGLTAWISYGAQWFANAVFEGDQNAPPGSPEKDAYKAGMNAFTMGGQFKALLQLISALLIIATLMYTRVRPRTVYAPCIFIGAASALLAAKVVGNNGPFAIACFTLSIMPETGSFAIPFGLVATLNERAREEGKAVSTALQMALLNCCITVGQEVCHLVLSWLEHLMELDKALPLIFMLAGVAFLISGSSALCLNDRPTGEEDSSDSSSSCSSSD